MFWGIKNFLVIKIKLELSVHTCRKNKQTYYFTERHVVKCDIKLYASNENQEQRDDKKKQYNPYYITSVAPNIVHCGGNFVSELILSNEENNDVRIFISSDTVCSPDFNKPTKWKFLLQRLQKRVRRLTQPNFLRYS